MADERDGYAKFLYALTNFALGDYEVAGVAIRRALLTTADLIDYPVDIRSLYPDKSRLSIQFDSLVAFVEDHPQDRDARLLLGYLQYAAGDPRLAMSILDPLATSGSEDEIVTLLLDAALRVSRMNDSDE
jgi:Flp pilus assembly protein TadD